MARQFRCFYCLFPSSRGINSHNKLCCFHQEPNEVNCNNHCTTVAPLNTKRKSRILAQFLEGSNIFSLEQFSFEIRKTKCSCSSQSQRTSPMNQSDLKAKASKEYQAQENASAGWRSSLEPRRSLLRHFLT